MAEYFDPIVAGIVAVALCLVWRWQVVRERRGGDRG